MVKPTPTIPALLVADQVFRQDTGKWCVIGTFDRIGSRQFPTTHPQLGVYLLLSDAEGEYDFQVQLVDANDKALATVRGRFQARSRLGRTEIGINFLGLRFPEPGVYFFRVLIDDEVITNDARLQLVEMTGPPPSGPPNAPPQPPFGSPEI